MNKFNFPLNLIHIALPAILVCPIFDLQVTLSGRFLPHDPATGKIVLKTNVVNKNIKARTDVQQAWHHGWTLGLEAATGWALRCIGDKLESKPAAIMKAITK